MKTKNIKQSFLILVLCISTSLFAQVPEKAEDISPLLVGEKLPEATLVYVDGAEVSLHKLIEAQPTVLVFYRGGWCLYCNQQLTALGEVEAEILDLGYQIIAISPDHYESLMPKVETSSISYSLYADPKAKLIQEIGIGFKTPTMAKTYISKKTNMDATDVLPVPTVMIINTKGDILFEYINPNYDLRISFELLLASLKALKANYNGIVVITN